MTRWQRFSGWSYKWRHLFAYVLIGAMAAYGFAEARDRRTEDARIERTAAINSCFSGNERLHTIRDVLLGAVRPPDPHSYDFIADPVLRAGVIEQSTKARERLTNEINTKLVDRDCRAEFPPPPAE